MRLRAWYRTEPLRAVSRFLLGGATALALSLLSLEWGLVFLLTCGLGGALWVRSTRLSPARRKRLAVIFVTAVGVRLAFIIIAALIRPELSSGFVWSGDPYTSDLIATELATSPMVRWTIPDPRYQNVYPYLLALFYRTLGTSLLIPRAFNVVVFLILLSYLYDLGERLFGDDSGFIACLLVALVPSLASLTIRVGDDIVSITLVVVCLYYVTTYQMERLHRRLHTFFVPSVIFALLLLTLFFIRDQIAIGLVIVTCAVVAYTELEGIWKKRFDWREAIGLGVVTSGFLVVLFKTGILFNKYAGLLRIASQKLQSVSSAGGDGLTLLILSAPLYARIPLGLVALYLMPFPPWDVLLRQGVNPSSALAATSIVVYVTFPLFLIGLHKAIFTRFGRTLPIGLYLFGTATALAALYGGTVPRFRTIIIAPYLLFVSYAFTRDLRQFKWLYAAYGLGFVGFTALYYMLTAIGVS